jgi:hypothetical protein
LGKERLGKGIPWVKLKSENIRAADAKEVGVGNPAEETYCYPNNSLLRELIFFVNSVKNIKKNPFSRNFQAVW